MKIDGIVMNNKGGPAGYLISKEIAKSKRGVILGSMLTFPAKKEIMASNPKSAGILGNAGVKVAILTDLHATPTRYLPLIVGVYISEGLSDEDAFRSITINAAEILGLNDKIGSLEKGKDADIIIYDGHPFVDVMSKCMITIINGEVVYQRS